MPSQVLYTIQYYLSSYQAYSKYVNNYFRNHLYRIIKTWVLKAQPMVGFIRFNGLNGVLGVYS
jgi:hypothetical protein